MARLITKLTQTSPNTWVLKFVGEADQDHYYLTWLIDDPAAMPLRTAELQDKELILDLPFTGSPDSAEIKLCLTIQHAVPEQDFQESQAIPLTRVTLRGGWLSLIDSSGAGPRHHTYPVYIPATGHTLTRREVQILTLLAAETTNRTIAEQLVVSRDTVKTHLKHIFAKLGVASRQQAIARARGLGLLLFSCLVYLNFI